MTATVRRSGEGTRPLRFEDHQTLRRPTDVAISPDGRVVAWSLPAGSYVDPDLGAQSRVWVAERSLPPRELIGGPGIETLPRFSPDSTLLAFACDRGHRGRLTPRVAEVESGRERELGSIAGSVEELSWSGDGRSLLVLAADIGSDRAGSFQATRISEVGSPPDDPRVFRPRRFFRRLFLVGLDDRTREVGLRSLTVWEAHWDQRSRAVGVVSADPSESGWFRPSLVIWDLGTGEVVASYSPKRQIAVPRLSPDGRHVAFVEALSSDRGDVAGTVMCAPIAGSALRPVVLSRAPDVSWIDWTGNDRLVWAGWRGVGTACGTVSTRGELDELWSGPATIGSRLGARVATNASGTQLATVLEASNVPPEVVRMDSRGARRWTPLTTFNDHLRSLQLPSWREVVWEAPDGLGIEGLLALPFGVDPSRLPLVVLAHGGPTTSWTHAWISDIPRLPLLWAGAGYAVLLPNPRGSRGYGQEFAAANVGDLGWNDLDDIVAGVDALAAQGLVAVDRVGITGNSYGGFLAAMAVGRSDRFAASIPMAVISNWLSYHNTSNSGAFDEIFLDADPYKVDGAYHRCSPVVYARGVTTPTLIMQGELDLCTPVGQAQELYQAIAECERGAVELVVFPREGHAYLEREHQVEIWSRSHAWFDRYLVGTPAAG